MNFRTNYFAIAIAGLAFLSCQKEEIAEDPAATITTSINYTENATPIFLYSGLAADGPYDYFGYSYPYVVIKLGMNASMNFLFHTAIVQNNSGTTSNPIWYGLGNIGGEIANVGKVSGLGAITTKPESGWATSVAVEVGKGYVIRYKESKDYNNANLPYHYTRLYVVEWVTSSTTGGVIGAKMKYELEF